MQFLSDKDRANLLGILDSIESILNFSGEYSDVEKFYQDKKTFDAVLMNFIIVGEGVSRLSDELKNNHPDIAWAKAKAFRNIIAHDYFGVNPEIVWQIIQDDTLDLKIKIGRILEEIQ